MDISVVFFATRQTIKKSAVFLGATMQKTIFILASTAFVCFLSYKLGQGRCQVETLVKEKEVIRYVEKQKSDIYSRPNVGRAELLELMRNNKL